MDEGLALGYRSIIIILAFAGGMLLGSLYAAVWLRLAAACLRMSTIPYLQAWGAALAANFVAVVFNFSIGFNHGFTLASMARLNPGMQSRNFERAFDLTFSYSPTYFLYAAVIGLMLTAVLFNRMLPGPTKETRYSFGDSVALAALWYALTFASALVIGASITFLIYWLLEVMNWMG